SKPPNQTLSTEAGELQPLGLLGIILSGRNPQKRPTNTDRLVAWHRDTRGTDWAQDEGVELRLLDACRMSTRISLVGRNLEGSAFEPVKIERSEEDWVQARARRTPRTLYR